MNLKNIIRESLDNNWDWINYGDDFITVNSDNIYDGAEVIINPESEFHEQAPYTLGIVQGEPNWFNGDLWVNVLFSGYGNQYRVGPNNFDLLITKSKDMNESEDDFDWIREIPINIPFNDLKIGTLYRIETTEVLRRALQACDKTERLLDAYMGIPAMRSIDPYNQIFCDHEREDRVNTIYLEFYDDNHRDLGNFWVSGDMVKFYPLKSDIKENEEDDFDWIGDSDPNPWIKHEYVLIDVKPTEENLKLLANLAINSGYIGRRSKENWLNGMTDNIQDIINYFNDEGKAYMRIEGGDFFYGFSLQPYGDWIKYSEIFGESINESEEDDFGWIRDTNFGIDMFINKAFYFDPIAEKGDEDYTKLVNHLINLGFESQYDTPTVLNDQAVGLYVYRDYNGDLKYVYTTFLDDDEDYELHIKGYATDNSEDKGENLELFDAREFIKLL